MTFLPVLFALLWLGAMLTWWAITRALRSSEVNRIQARVSQDFLQKSGGKRSVSVAPVLIPKDRFEGADIWLDGVLVGDELRTEETGSAASKIAALPKVRAALLNKQRAFRRPPGLVADGRDMASVVFPDAVLKIFLTASAEARAERRYKQLKEKGIGANIAALLQDIRARDERDTQRSVAPLQQAQGASLLDTTSLNIEQAVQEVLSRYRALESK